MFNLQSYSETGRDLLSIEFTSRATSWESQSEANEWDPLPWGTCRGRASPAASHYNPQPFKHFCWGKEAQNIPCQGHSAVSFLLAARCPAGKESRRWICPSIAYCSQIGAGSERARQEFHSSCPSLKKGKHSVCQSFGIFQPLTQTEKADHQTGREASNMF